MPYLVTTLAHTRPLAGLSKILHAHQNTFLENFNTTRAGRSEEGQGACLPPGIGVPVPHQNLGSVKKMGGRGGHDINLLQRHYTMKIQSRDARRQLLLGRSLMPHFPENKCKVFIIFLIFASGFPWDSFQWLICRIN